MATGMKKNFDYWTRKTHRWGALLFCLPLILVIVSGLLLQLKKQVPWVQPATESAGHSTLALSWEQILEVTRSEAAAEVRTWDDIDRLDVRPSRGIVKVQAINRHEVQIDMVSGEILSSTYRRSDLIESLHDGSFFGSFAKLGVFLGNGIVLLGLWLTGAWLWYLPVRARSRKRRRMREQDQRRPGPQRSATER